MAMRILLCSTSHAGTVAQVMGVARAFAGRLPPEAGLASIRRHSRYDDLARLLPRGLNRWAPDVVVSSGSNGARKALRQRACDPALFWVHLDALVYPDARPDLHAVPAHDWLPGHDEVPWMMVVAGAPHGVTSEGVAARRDGARGRLGLGSEARAAMFLVGGPSRACALSEADAARIADAVANAAAAGFRCFVTASRRTPKAARARLAALEGPAVVIWSGAGPNPYQDYLAAADRLFVTEDSITMACEAAATGRPTFHIPLTPVPGPAHEKLRRFHARWAPFVRPLPEADQPHSGPGGGEPPDDAARIAERMAVLWRARRSGGRVPEAGA